MELGQLKISTPVGSFYLLASEKGLRGLFTKDPKVKSKSASILKLLKQGEAELQEYFSGKRQQFSIKLDLVGTDFERKVWKALYRIPYGKTISYKDLALKIKNPKAFRAVGSANGRNPLCIIVPCHRVIAANGKLGGYSGGLMMKRKLLKLEGITSAAGQF